MSNKPEYKVEYITVQLPVLVSYAPDDFAPNYTMILQGVPKLFATGDKEDDCRNNLVEKIINKAIQLFEQDDREPLNVPNSD